MGSARTLGIRSEGSIARGVASYLRVQGPWGLEIVPQVQCTGSYSPDDPTGLGSFYPYGALSIAKILDDLSIPYHQ